MQLSMSRDVFAQFQRLAVHVSLTGEALPVGAQYVLLFTEGLSPAEEDVLALLARGLNPNRAA
jgi:hypothetical protein